MSPVDLATLRQKLLALLGPLPPRDKPPVARTLSVQEHGTMLVETLVLDLNPYEQVPALFVRPKNAAGPRPTVLYHHWHAGQFDLGKNEILTNREKSWDAPPYAVELTARGWNVLCIDQWCFGERRGPPQDDLFKELLWKGQVLWGWMMHDYLRSVDWVVTRPEVDGTRLAAMGMSMGSTASWWLAALDERIAVTVDLCCLTEFDTLLAGHGLSGHGIYYFVPALLNHFTTTAINALIAPRPHLALAGNYDSLTPVAGLDKLDRELAEIYKQAGAPQNWKLARWNVGHMETREMRQTALDWLERHLTVAHIVPVPAAPEKKKGDFF